MADGAHVLGDDVSAAADEGVGAGGLRQRDRGTGRASVGDQVLQLLEVVLGRFARGEDDVDDVLLDLLVHIDVLDHRAGLDDVLGRDDAVHGGHAPSGEVHAHDVALLLLVGIGDPGLEHETVHLCLGQRVGPLLLEGVLRGQHEEGLRQRVGLLADGYLALLHRFEQCRLHLGRRTVDLVGEDEVGEDWALADEEVLALLRIDQRTDQVGRQQVGGKLDTRELGVHGLGQRGDGQCLGQSRDALEEDVPVRKQADQQRIDQMALADDDLAHFRAQRIDEDRFAFDALVEFLDVDDFAHGLCFVVLLPILFFNVRDAKLLFSAEKSSSNSY